MTHPPRPSAGRLAGPAPATTPRRPPHESQRLLLSTAIRRVRQDVATAGDDVTRARALRELHLLLQSRAKLDQPRDEAPVRYWVYAARVTPDDVAGETDDGRLCRLVVLDATATPAAERLFRLEGAEVWLPLDGELHAESGVVAPTRVRYALTPTGGTARVQADALEADAPEGAAAADAAHATAVDQGGA